MPKRSDISSVMIIGAGPIVIGQACEFDYSGTQACKALREEGIRVILVNSNPATIMTDPEVADATYIEPLTSESLEKIIAAERPDALLSTVGGQTGLNCSFELHDKGILDKYNVKMIGAKPEVIYKAENNEEFNKAMAKNGLEVPRNVTVSSVDEAMEHFQSIGLPAIVRPSFTLGGAGGGIARTPEEYKSIVAHGLDLSPINQVQIDESLLGWKEYEMEVVRDLNDNAIIVCSIENVDPMGVHTGDSITVAPALTLTDKEYQIMRDASLAVLREIGVETGGSNVQFAVNPENGRMVVIEMNPRVSRSSALASKATGFPIAKVAAKLAVGYTLDEIQNDITRVTPASFEPAIDYVVTKIPRFNFEKFGESKPVLSSAMRSVGEVMSIGRSFAESLQKGICSLEMGHNGLNTPFIEGLDQAETLEQRQAIMREALEPLCPDRIFRVAEAFRQELSVEEVNKITGIDRWFLHEIAGVISLEQDVLASGLPQDKKTLLRLKKTGISDDRLAQLGKTTPQEVRQLRQRLDVRPVFKTVDTCAAEFKAETAYLYSCYEGNSRQSSECEAHPSDRKKIVILGSGPNRIGQGIEFDYTCVHAAKSLSQEGFETIMVNCNPETVSTDYDTSDKLYFEPLHSEHVLELIRREQENGELLGVIVQFGGQTPLKLSQTLKAAGIPILGTSPDSIDLAENRERFQQLLKKLELKQPKNSISHDLANVAANIKKTVGYPVVIRPSNVLGGRAMAILKSQQGLEKYLLDNFPALKQRADIVKQMIEGSGDKNLLEDLGIQIDGPVLLDRFLDNAVEIDVDAICDGREVYISGIMEHIERAGIHSGDSACVLPPHSLSQEMLRQISESSEKLARALNTIGPINIQYAVQNEQLFVIEVNPRASRTIPFVAKVTGVPVAKLASLVMVGKRLSDFNLPKTPPQHFAVKEAVLPFTRFPNADTLLGPEMKSTGESMGHAKDLHEAFAKAQSAAFNPLPNPNEGGLAVIACPPEEQARADKLAGQLRELGMSVIRAGKELDERLGKEKKSLLEFFQSSSVALVAVTDRSDALKELRRESAMARVPYFTTHEALEQALNSLIHRSSTNFTVRKLQDIAVSI